MSGLLAIMLLASVALPDVLKPTAPVVHHTVHHKHYPSNRHAMAMDQDDPVKDRMEQWWKAIGHEQMLMLLWWREFKLYGPDNEP